MGEVEEHCLTMAWKLFLAVCFQTAECYAHLDSFCWILHTEVQLSLVENV